MNIREISKPVTAKSLNESLAKRFGQKLNIDAFTVEQLEDARNKIRTKLSQVEMNENFDSVIKNENYQKSKLFLDVLNTAIAEREDANVEEGSKPDFPDIDGDGNTKEPIGKAAKDKKDAGKGKKPKKGVVPPQFKKKNESIVKEGAEDAAELVMAAKDMVDRVTGWMEDTAEMQTESMLELADAIRDEMGSEKSEAFTASVKPALEAMYGVMETTRQTLTAGVGQLTGEEDAVMPDAMGADPLDEPLPADPEMEPLDDDGMGAADAAMGGEEEAGREKRESVQRGSKKKLAERSRRLATTLSKKKS
jgi:cell division septum initiation protein DivIVA